MHNKSFTTYYKEDNGKNILTFEHIISDKNINSISIFIFG